MTLRWQIQTFRWRWGEGLGGNHPDPAIRGAWSQKNFFQPFRPKFGLKIRGGGGGQPLPWIHHCAGILKPLPHYSLFWVSIIWPHLCHFPFFNPYLQNFDPQNTENVWPNCSNSIENATPLVYPVFQIQPNPAVHFHKPVTRKYMYPPERSPIWASAPKWQPVPVWVRMQRPLFSSSLICQSFSCERLGIIMK